jgi:FkbM family methyltransferase
MTTFRNNQHGFWKGVKRPPEDLAIILRRRLLGGKRFYGTFCPDVGMQLDEFIYDRYFKNEHLGVCCECGALDGVTNSNGLFFEESLGWECYNIEPSPESFLALVHNRGNSRNYNMALSDRDGKVNFSISRLAGLDSICPYDGEETEILEVINVETRTYKTFIEYACIKKLDLFVLDVEGHEIHVINGMYGASVFPYVFCIECWDIHRFNRVNALLDKFGYFFDAQTNNNYIFVRSAPMIASP